MFICARCKTQFVMQVEDKLLSAIFGEYICEDCRNDEDEQTRIIVNGIPLSEYLAQVGDNF